MESSEGLYPLALLIDELRDDDTGVRVSAMSRISVIALALGEERTRQELLPFLEDTAQEDDDEILVVLADELAKFVPLVGGPQYAHSLLEVLMLLAYCEEPTVRDAAVHALCVVGDAMTDESLQKHFIPLVKKLSEAEWFSSRMSAAGLYATVLARLPEPSLLVPFKELVTDDAPMVRRAAATALPGIVRVLSANVVLENSLADMFLAIRGDDQDSVRLLSVDVAIALGKKLRECQDQHRQPSSIPRPNDTLELLAKNSLELLDDKSWRVRFMAADRFEELSNVFALDDYRAEFANCFHKLCRDQEAEVRTAIAKRIVGFCKHLDAAIILSDVVPDLGQLTEDPSEHVRESLASQIANLSPLVGKDDTIEHLLPLFLQILKDDHSEVRLQIISNLQVINQVIGIDLLSQSLLPAIAELAKDRQWRVLLAIIEYLPLLAEQLGEPFFNRELVPLVVDWLWAPVWAVRDAAAKTLVKLAGVFGGDWLQREILPKITQVPSQNANYLHRLTALLVVKTLIEALPVDVLEAQVLPYILSMTEDPVANIRFNCAKAFQVLSRTLSAKDPKTELLIRQEIVPALEKHANDADVDVRFFVSGALEDINSHLDKPMEA